MVTYITQQSSSEILSMVYPRKLSRAATYDALVPRMTSRKRLLSEQNDFRNSTTELSNDVIHVNKRKKTESCIDDSNNNNHHHVPCVSSRSSFGNIYCPPSPTTQRRSSFTHINNLPCSQSITSPQPSTVTKNMLVCQQKSTIENDNENEQEAKNTSSTLVTSSELTAYVMSNQNGKLLIIDCGTPLRYNERRINESVLLNVNDKLSRKRLINRGLKNFLDHNQLNRLNQSEILILYDDSTHSFPCSKVTVQPVISPAIKCIFDEIKRYDSDKTIYILQSSFDEFHQLYPTFCYISSSNINNNEHPLTSPSIDIESYEMSEVLPGLYLGNSHDAEDKNLLNKNEIKSIVNISTTIPCHYMNETPFDYLQLPCNDSCQENILQYFEKTFEYMDKKLSLNQNILVHCQGGISRSPSFIIGYLMKYHSKTFDQAYSLVKGKRKIINPNLNFLAQLTRYEQMIRSTTQ